MTPFKSIFLFSFLLISCNRHKRSECNFIRTNFYSTGKVQLILSLNSDSIKNGECFYFNEFGFLDSSVNFSNGILQGLKRRYYDNQTDTYEYQNGNLVSYCVYDSLNYLKYKTPLDFKKVGKPQLTFLNHRNYAQQDCWDTFTIKTDGLPPYNLVISVKTGTFRFVNDTTFSIKPPKQVKDLHQVILLIAARQNISDTIAKPVLIDSIAIPVK